jgi:hypothetical protein
VGIRYDGGAGAAVPATSFSDAFSGPDRPFFLGNDWYLVGTADNTTAPVDWGGQINIGAGALTYGNGGGVNDNGMFCYAFPSKVDYNAVLARSLAGGLFAELTIVGRAAGVDCGIGPFLFAQPGSTPSYFQQIESINAVTQLFRKENAGSTSLVGNAFNNVNGDTVRLEARITGGNVELKSYQNGVLRNTFVDNTASKITSGGLFGIAFQGVFTGTVSIKDFHGGAL